MKKYELLYILFYEYFKIDEKLMLPRSKRGSFLGAVPVLTWNSDPDGQVPAPLSGVVALAMDVTGGGRGWRGSGGSSYRRGVGGTHHSCSRQDGGHGELTNGTLSSPVP